MLQVCIYMDSNLVAYHERLEPVGCILAVSYQVYFVFLFLSISWT